MKLYKFTDKLNRKLNVRELPDKCAPVASQIESGMQFEGYSVGNWIQTDKGFVMASLVVEVDPDTNDDALNSMGIKELRELAEQSGIKLKANMKKAEIIKAILDE